MGYDYTQHGWLLINKPLGVLSLFKDEDGGHPTMGQYGEILHVKLSVAWTGTAKACCYSGMMAALSRGCQIQGAT
jgi:hypothetical protein